jgi:predicted aspartyl protease
MYITKRNAIHVPFSLCSNAKKVEERTLLDSGTTHNFMDSRMAKRLGIGTKALARPRSIINVDGTGNQAGTLTRYTDLSISYQGVTEVQHFFITNLGEDRAIFGFPWFQTFNLKVNWKKAKIEGSAMVKTMRERPPQWTQIS